MCYVRLSCIEKYRKAIDSLAEIQFSWPSYVSSRTLTKSDRSVTGWSTGVSDQPQAQECFPERAAGPGSWCWTLCGGLQSGEEALSVPEAGQWPGDKWQCEALDMSSCGWTRLSGERGVSLPSFHITWECTLVLGYGVFLPFMG